MNHLVARIDDVTRPTRRAARSLPLSLSLFLDTRRCTGVCTCRAYARTDATSPPTDRMLDPRLLVPGFLFSPAAPHLSSSRRASAPPALVPRRIFGSALTRSRGDRRRHVREKLPRRSTEIDESRERERRGTRDAT